MKTKTNEFLEELKKAPVWSWITIAEGWNGINIRAVLWNSDEGAKFFQKANKFLKLSDIKEAFQWLQENELNIAFWDTLTLVSKKLYAERRKEIRLIPQEAKELVWKCFIKTFEGWKSEIFLIEDVTIDETVQRVWIKSNYREREVLGIKEKLVLHGKRILWRSQGAELSEVQVTEKKYIYFLNNNFTENGNYKKLFA